MILEFFVPHPCECAGVILQPNWYFVCMCTNAATMAYSPVEKSQTTVILAALHPDPQPKADHKTPF